MIENSFIQLDSPSVCNIPILIWNETDISFFTGLSEITQVNINNPLGESIKANIAYAGDECLIIQETLSLLLNDGDCFYLEIISDGEGKNTNMFKFITDKTNTTLLKYFCNSSEFGFDYDIENSYNQVRLPIRLHSAQFPQEEKIYTDSNGVRKQLFAKIDKEWELETEYLPVEWHEKLITALAHDEVYFDGEKLQKSAEYVINYEDEDVMDCGIKLYKATAKLTKNQTIRNNFK